MKISVIFKGKMLRVYDDFEIIDIYMVNGKPVLDDIIDENIIKEINKYLKL